MRLADVLGQAGPRALLMRSVIRQTVPHSLLFDGPDGVGKRTTALALAAALNCQQPSDGDACGLCSPCRRIDKGHHPDVVLVEPNEKGTITVDMARDISSQASYRPFEGRRRVVVIDQADELQPAAQNALLKILEEPPPSSMFILVSSRADVLLVTVRSRSARVRFGRLTSADVAEVLTRRCGIAAKSATALASLADGSVSRALAQEAGELGEARRAALALLDGVSSRPPATARLRLAQQLAEVPKKRGGGSDRDVLDRRLEALGLLVRDVGVIGQQGPERVLANPDLDRELSELARQFDADRVLNAFALVEQARRSLDRFQSPKVVADWLVCEI